MGKPDRSTLGSSASVPFCNGENAQARHVRRLKAALHRRREVSDWALLNSFEFSVHNNGQHWKLQGPFLAEWWPSSAKLVFNKMYNNGIHCHDVDSLLRALNARLGG